MPRTTITVDGTPFFGRVEEQKRFRAALQEVLHNPRGEDLPRAFGNVGIQLGAERGAELLLALQSRLSVKKGNAGGCRNEPGQSNLRKTLPTYINSMVNEREIPHET